MLVSRVVIRVLALLVAGGCSGGAGDICSDGEQCGTPEVGCDTEVCQDDSELRPAMPTTMQPVPSQWKFAILPVTLRFDPSATLKIEWNGAELAKESQEHSDDGGTILTLVMPTVGESATLVAVVEDDDGRRSQPFERTILRLPYKCLSSLDGFPYPHAKVIESSDDQQGTVFISYALGADAADDVHISSLLPEDNFGLETILAASAVPGFRVLLRLHDGLIPPCASITAATIRLFGPLPCPTCEQPGDLHAYRMTTPWEEHQATWNLAANDRSWSQPGLAADEDYEPVAVGSLLFTEESYMATMEVLEPLRDWQRGQNGAMSDAATNSGFLMVSTDAGSVAFFSTEYFDENLRPRLELTLVEPP